MSGAPAERFDLATLPAQPWKNGGGVTREIAVCPPGAGFDAFEWRLSVADVARDGPFSAFPGIDRCLVLLRGAGLRLHDVGGGSTAVLDRPGEAFAFAGEAAIDAHLVDGTTVDFNVMTRRGSWSADALTITVPTRLPDADATLLLCGAGRWVIDTPAASPPLDPGQVLLWRTPAGPLAVRPDERSGTTAWLLAVRLCQHRP